MNWRLILVILFIIYLVVTLVIILLILKSGIKILKTDHKRRYIPPRVYKLDNSELDNSNCSAGSEFPVGDSHDKSN